MGDEPEAEPLTVGNQLVTAGGMSANLPGVTAALPEILRAAGEDAITRFVEIRAGTACRPMAVKAFTASNWRACSA